MTKPSFLKTTSIQDYLDPKIVPSQFWKTIDRVLNNSANDVLYEIHLNNSNKRIDFGRNYGANQKQELLYIIKKKEKWISLKKIVEKWIAPNNLINQYLTSLWLEYDFIKTRSINTSPSCYLCFRNKKKSPNASTLQKILMELHTLCDLKITNSMIKKTCQTKLNFTKLINIYWIGLMLSRKEKNIRLVMTPYKNKKKELFEILKQITKKNEITNIQKKLTKITIPEMDISIGLDFGKKISKKIHCEFFLSKKTDFKEKKILWRNYLKILIKNKCCNPIYDEVILKWLGGHRIEGSNLKVIRDISHVKHIFNQGKLLETKIYLRQKTNTIHS